MFNFSFYLGREVLRILVPDANIYIYIYTLKTDAVLQSGAIVVAREERCFAPRDGYWNGFSNIARGTWESLPLQRSKYILLHYALMHYSGPHPETVAALSYFVTRSCADRHVANCNALTNRIISWFFSTFVKYNDEALSRVSS